jgi:outer membrane protein assembly factor BamB
MRRRACLQSAVAVAAVFGLSGCFWGQSGFDAGGSGYNRYESRVTAANVSSLVELWRADVDGTNVRSVIQSGEGLIHVADHQAVYGFDAATGERRWRTPLAGLGDGYSFPAADSDDVLIGAFGPPSGPGSLAQLEAATGALTGTHPIDARTIDAPGIEKLHTVRTGDWAVTVFAGDWLVGASSLPWSEADFTVTNLTDPSRSWSYTHALDTATETQVISKPVIVGGRAYAVLRTIRVVSIEPFVFEVARLQVAGWDLAEPCTSPCDPDWTVDLPRERPGSNLAASHDGTTLFTSVAGKLHAIDIASGTVAWTANAPESVADVAPTSTPDGVFVTNAVSTGPGNALVAYPPGCGAPTCAPAWTTPLPGHALGQVTATEDLLFVATRDNTLAAYPAVCTDGCAPLWSINLGTRLILSPPVISRGRVVVATSSDDRTTSAIMAFGLPPSG